MCTTTVNRFKFVSILIFIHDLRIGTTSVFGGVYFKCSLMTIENVTALTCRLDLK